MWNWFRQLISRKGVAPRVVAPTPQQIRVDPPKLRVIDGGLSQGSRFDQLMSLTGQMTPDPVLLTPEQQAVDDSLVAQVLEHFRKNRPAPSALPAVSLQVLNLVAEPDLSLSELSPRRLAGSRVFGGDPQGRQLACVRGCAGDSVAP